MVWHIYLEEGIADVNDDYYIAFDMAAGVQLQLDLRHGEGFFTTSTTILLNIKWTLDIFTELEDSMEIHTDTPRPRLRRQIV